MTKPVRVRLRLSPVRRVGRRTPTTRTTVKSWWAITLHGLSYGYETVLGNGDGTALVFSRKSDAMRHRRAVVHRYAVDPRDVKVEPVDLSVRGAKSRVTTMEQGLGL